MNQAVQTTVASLKPPVQESVANLPAIAVGFTSLQGFELLQRAAKMMSAATLVPKEYHNNIPNCAIALNIADRIGADALMVMQNLVIVHGRPTWSSQFLISTVNTCGRFTALRFEFFGERNTDGWGCRAWAIEKSTGEKLVGTDITIKIAKDEGWYGRNGSKWKTIPQQMLMYRAGSWWARAYAPELSMGLRSAEEMVEVYDAERQEDGSYAINLEALKEANGHTASGNGHATSQESAEDAKPGEPAEAKKAPPSAAAEAALAEREAKAAPGKEPTPEEMDKIDADEAARDGQIPGYLYKQGESA